jgi:L,D-transpeptidase ErfK/SrfK
MPRFDTSRRQVLMGLGGAVAASLVGAPVLAATRGSAGRPDIVGELRRIKTVESDTLLDIARRYNLGYVEIVTANPQVDPWLPGEGTEIVLPTVHVLPDAPREGIVLNLSDQRLYYFPAGKPIETFAIGIGADGWNTPKGRTKVVRKAKNPTWFVPKSILKEEPDHPKIVRPGPDNPLGKHAIYLEWPAYLIHGTNKPDGVGRRVSHGCIRMYPEGAERLYEVVAIGTPVTVVDQQAKFGWIDGELYLEIHPSQKQTDQIEETRTFETESVPDLQGRVKMAARDQVERIDWSVVDEAAIRRAGFPVRITRDRSLQSSAR